jgi:hypothetical protein
MAIFGKNGLVRRQEVAFAKKLLVWKYEKSGLTLPSEDAISAHAEQIVEDAHRIAKESGNTVADILKNKMKDLKK